MKRRDFLKTPGLGLLVPAALGSEATARLSSLLPPDGKEELAEKFQQSLHADFNTYQPGIEYFLLGNGDIQAVVQYAPKRDVDRPQTFIGLTIMSPEHFARKWSSFLFHPEIGFGRTMVTITIDGKPFPLTPDLFRSIAWKYENNIPVVSLHWAPGSLQVEEEFFLPEEGAALFRRIKVKNNGANIVALSVNLAMVPNFALFDDIGTMDKGIFGNGFSRIRLLTDEKKVITSFRYYVAVDKETLASGESSQTLFTYAIGGAARKPSRSVTAVERGAMKYWSQKTQLNTGNELLDHLFRVAKTGMKANIARSGKRDSGIWMYNMEWVRDDSMFVVGLTQAGFADEAKTILTKMLERSVGEDGRTIESSRWFGFDYTELDQNGQLLYAVWAYICWTGDEKFLKKYWKKLALVADFPLQDIFWNKTAGLLRNKREYWERNDTYGFTDGFELAYQFWNVLGLGKAAELAKKMGDQKSAAKWRDASRRIKSAMLDDPKFRLIEDGHFIKRRAIDGEWQRFISPPNKKSMPPGSPLATEDKTSCDPDTCEVQPIVYGLVDPASPLARKTLEWVDMLWNQRWDTGGYSRYNVSSEPDPPAPWPLASLFVARAYTEVRNSEKVWRILNWLDSISGAKSGSYFERVGPSITPPAPPVAIVGWTWAEIVGLISENMMGVRPELDEFVLRPNLLDGINEMSGWFNIRNIDVNVTVKRGLGKPSATVNGKDIPLTNGALVTKYPYGGLLKIEMNV